MKDNEVLNSSVIEDKNKFILSGEDDIDDQQLLEEIFIILGGKFVLVHIDNGNKILEYLSLLTDEQLPCLIILDYNMPGMNGSQILQQLHKEERYQSIPKIVWSTSGSPAYKSSCLELGARDYLVKPSDMKALLEAVKYMIGFCKT